MLLIFIVLNLFFLLNFDRIKLFRLINDKPDNKRKIHLKPIPLAGGIILMINISIYFILVLINPSFFPNEVFFKNDLQLFIFIITSILIFFIGIFDDEYNLSPNLKIFLLSSVIFLILYFDNDLIIRNIRISFLDHTVGTKNLGTLFTFFCVLVFLNAFNMFDGINLQASIYSISIFLFLSFMVIQSFFILIIIIYLISYSILNYRNKSFLGDSGSLLLAFLISYIFIKLYNSNFIEFSDEIFIFMMIPGIDLIRLFFIRIIKKKNPLKPDKDHLHHLLISKFSPLKSILILHSMIIVPVFLNYINIGKFFIILTAIFFYISIIKILKS